MRQSGTDSEAAYTQPRLSQERILQTAIAIVEREGEGSLSMRRIAQELDVWPMSLYRYFHDKQTLLDALAEAAAEQIDIPDTAADWQTQLRQLLGQARTALAQHPGGPQLQLSGPALPSAAERVRAAGVETLKAAGFPAEEAEAGWRALIDYAAGSTHSRTEQFEYGLDLLLVGLQSHAVTAGSI